MILALVLATAFAATPQAAALQSTSAAAVTRTNIVGDVATVFVSRGRVEGERVDLPVLVQHFSFGWQPVDLLTSPCEIYRRGLPASMIATLIRGMQPTLGCQIGPPFSRDVGARLDVEAIRYQMRGPFVPTVIVAGSFARGEWYGAGGGETFFQRTRSRWTRIGGGGGALGARDLRRLGIPMSAICAFHTYDAQCPK